MRAWPQIFHVVTGSNRTFMRMDHGAEQLEGIKDPRDGVFLTFNEEVCCCGTRPNVETLQSVPADLPRNMSHKSFPMCSPSGSPSPPTVSQQYLSKSRVAGTPTGFRLSPFPCVAPLPCHICQSRVSAENILSKETPKFICGCHDGLRGIQGRLQWPWLSTGALLAAMLCCIRLEGVQRGAVHEPPCQTLPPQVAARESTSLDGTNPIPIIIDPPQTTLSSQR